MRAVLADIGLEVAEARSGIVKTNTGFEFLGFSLSGRSLRPRARALKGFKDGVRALTPRKAPCSLARTIQGLNPLLRGWGGYFGRADVISLFKELDKWIRMRLRSQARKRFKSKGG